MEDLLGCEHKRTSFVQSRSGMGYRHEIRICEQCGEIRIWAVKDGVSFDLNFHIHDPAQLDMMRKWTDYVWADYPGGKP